MTRLEPADSLAALMRAQLTQLRRDVEGKKGTAARTGRAGTDAGQPSDAASMASARIRSIALDDPERENKAIRAFLECVFLSEFGSQLASDAAFTRMVDHVQEQMQADPQLAAAASQAAQALLKSA